MVETDMERKTQVETEVSMCCWVTKHYCSGELTDVVGNESGTEEVCIATDIGAVYDG